MAFQVKQEDGKTEKLNNAVKYCYKLCRYYDTNSKISAIILSCHKF